MSIQQAKDKVAQDREFKDFEQIQNLTDRVEYDIAIRGFWDDVIKEL